MRLPRRTTALLLALLPACGGDAGGPQPAAEGAAGRLAAPPDIVLVTVDTLRADHLGCYGYHRDTSPVVDALAAEGLLFERAYATMATTLPSHLSLMTGLYPHQHGYVANRGAVAASYRPTPGRRPAAELLREQGYATAAFVSGPTVSRATGIQAGFETFDQHETKDFADIRDHSRKAGVTVARAVEWLATAPDRPLFLWVHLWDPHEPNIPLPEWAGRFAPDAGLERLIDARRIDPARLRARFDDMELARLFAPELIAELRAGRPVELPPIDRDAIRDLLDRYDADVRYTDACVGQLFDALRARGRFDDAVVVFTSDHGQALGQHDWLEHGRIQVENTHVPLVMRFPAGLVPQPARVPGVVSLVDVLPTVLARFDGPASRELLDQAEGEDLLSGRFERPWAFSQRSIRDRDWEPGDAGEGIKLALTLDRWRFYHRPGGRDELYDLEADPGETVDVVDRHPDLARRLARIAGEVFARRAYLPGEGGEGPLSPEAQEYLDALKTTGYVGEK